MRRFFSVLLILAALLSLSGCGAGRDKAEGSATITIWHDKEEPVVQVLQAALTKLEPDLHVVFEKKSSLTESLKLVGNDPKAAPDMYLFAHDKMGVYAEMGILTPVTDLIGEDAFADYLPLTVKAASYKGVQYQLPLYFETLLFMYNRRYMSKEEIPETTEALYDYMERKTKYGHYGFVEQHSTPYYAAGWIHAFGSALIDGDGAPLLNAQATKDALSYHLKFVRLMPGETEYATVNTLFTEGKAHATIAGPWFVPTVRNAGIDVGIAPMPVVDQTGLPLAPYSGVQGVHVLRVAAERKPDAVKKVLEALMDPQVSVDLALVSGCAPAQASCYESGEIKTNELVMAMRQTAESAVPMPSLPEMDVMWTVAGSLLTNVNMSGQDVDTAAKEAQKKAIELIEAMK